MRSEWERASVWSGQPSAGLEVILLYVWLVQVQNVEQGVIYFPTDTQHSQALTSSIIHSELPFKHTYFSM